MGTARFGRTVLASAAALAGLAGLALAAPSASAAGQPSQRQQPAPRSALLAAPRPAALPAGQRSVCARPSAPGQMACQSILVLPGKNPARAALAFSSAAVSVPGYGPSSLRSAYGLAAAALRNGRGETVAVVDAFSNPDLAGNLAAYRTHFGLPACTKANGCLRIMNQAGRSGPLPAANADWGVEESLDLDMVSAICPRCKIVLVEANSAAISSLGVAEATALAKGARFVSNSWGNSEFTGQDTFSHFFNHPGDAIVFASGDFGYGPSFPADLQYVTSVGGTTLRHLPSGRRAWTESAWGGASGDGTGSGCSSLEAKPSWQREDDVTPAGCLNRTQNDVAAVANPATGVSVYDTFGTGGSWGLVGGTSVATPIITATYALAGLPARGTYPASYPYAHARALNDVRGGLDGSCEPRRQYLCHAVRGYDGPTGLGTPNGTAAFSSRGTSPVTVLDPGVQDLGAGRKVSLTIRADDGDAAARALSYHATGLPRGLRITPAARSLNARISGRLPAAAGSYRITVTARDRRTGRSSATRFRLYVIASLTASSPSSGNVLEADVAGSCLSSAGGSAAAGTRVQIGPCDSSRASNWAYVAGAGPGQAGKMTIGGGICLGLSGANAQLQACSRAPGQVWAYEPTASPAGLPTGYLVNPASRRCLNGQSYAEGSGVVATSCGSAAFEDWTLTGQSLRSGAGGLCVSYDGTPGQQARAAGCAASADQALGFTDETITGAGGWCFDVQSMLDNASVIPDVCGGTTASSQQWLLTPAGQLMNAGSGRCLEATGRGQPLKQEDCYGLPGEIWAIN